MALLPRSNEVAAVVAILESDDHDDATAMAKAIVRAVAAEISKRDLYIIFPPTSPIGYGPYFSETDAARAWKKEIGSSFPDRKAKLLHTLGWVKQDEQNAGCECGHPKALHVVRGPKNAPGKPTDCGRYPDAKTKCPCPSYSERKRA